MAPLPNKYPYMRFDPRNPDPENPNKVLFNADGFTTGWFNLVSSGTLSSKTSFAALHPDFLDQTFLNRLIFSDNKELTIFADPKAIEVPIKNAAWIAPENLSDFENQTETIKAKTGHKLIIVRMQIKARKLDTAGVFTLSQIRLICKPSSEMKNPLLGKAKNIYPIGYLKTSNLLLKKRLNDIIIFTHADLKGPEKSIDLAFYLPNDFVPAILQFKQNCIVTVPKLVPAEKAPQTEPVPQPLYKIETHAETSEANDVNEEQ